MWEQIIALVSKVLAPRSFTNLASQVEGEILIPVTTASAKIQIPSWLRGRYVELTAIGADVAVLFGTSSVAVTLLAETTIGADPFALTVNAATGRYIIASTTRSFVVPTDTTITHMGYDASAAGHLQISPTSKKVE